MKCRLVYDECDNQIEEKQIVGKANNSQDTFEKFIACEEDISTNKTDGNVASMYTCVCCDATDMA